MELPLMNTTMIAPARADQTQVLAVPIRGRGVCSLERR